MSAKCEYKGKDAPKLKKGSTPKTIKEAQPKPVPLRYAQATGLSAALGENVSTYDKPKRRK
jgi:hypothetical protein